MKRLLFLIPLFLLFANSPTSNEMGISLETNYRNYRPGQSIKINVKLPQAAYLYILTLQSNGNLNLLYPNEDEQDNMIFNEEIKIPDDSKDYEFLAGDTVGKDSIIAIASRNRIKKLHKSKYFLDLKTFSASLANGKIAGNIRIDNFSIPNISASLNANLLLNDVRNLLKIDTIWNYPIASLAGSMRINMQYKGKLNKSGKYIRSDFENMLLSGDMAFLCIAC